ncbi:MAG: hypothetical protein JJT89_12535 [Nitriliruptoraceae bacterium]|nr:hypothetical protein [Nitriliruptoraceae bacterium]
MSRDLTTLRRVWLAALAALLLLSAAPLAAGAAAGDALGGPSQPTLPVALPLALLGSVGVAAIVAVVAVDRLYVLTPPTDDVDAVRRLQVRSLLQYGLAEAPVLLGVALAVAIGPAWVIVAATVPALVALGLAAPRLARLDRLDQAWEARGHDVSIRRGLAEVADPDDADGSDASDASGT